MVDAYEEITRLEAALRDLVRLVLGGEWRDALGPQALEVIEARRDTDHQRRRGVQLEGDLLEYTELTQLQSVIRHNWEAFHPAIGPKKEVELYLEKVGGIRNAVAHTRPLLPFEEHLVAGISGYYRNRIASYRSSVDTADQIWPTLNSVQDSFGNTVTQTLGSCTTGVTLRVGDQVTFRCAATDPDGVALTWTVTTWRSSRPRDTAEGDTAELTWTPTVEDIGANIHVVVNVASSRAHHRHQGADGLADFVYRVLPA